jgi:polyphenol oxidase
MASSSIREGEKWLADLSALARLRMNALGITQIYGGDYCTYRDSERFFSYRRDGATGRMGTFIWLE